MKLYYNAGACSLCPHIVLREAGLSFSLEPVNLGTKRLANGDDYRAINPKGYVPALQLDDGAVLTEVAAVVQYIADQRPGSKLAPAWGTLERYRLIEWLNYLSSEIHKGYGPMWDPKTPEEMKLRTRDALGVRLGWIDKQLDGKNFLMGDDFSVADAYLYVLLTWASDAKLELATWPRLGAFMKRVEDRPAVKAALEAEKEG